MSMSDDPRYRRGQANQRQPAQQSRDGRSGTAAAPQRGFGQPDAAADRSERQPSFSAYRPEAYAGSSKQSARPDWDDDRSSAPRPQSPAAEAYPRPAPERPASQKDTRDPYRSPSSDPYAAPQRDYDADWRSSSYHDTGNFQDSSYQSGGGKFGSFYEEPPQVNDVQAVHDRFFASDPDPEPNVTRYRGVVDRNVTEYADTHFDAGASGNSFSQNDAAYTAPPQPRASYGGEQDYGWDNYDQAPAPQALRPYQAPGSARDEDMDADFFADEDEFDGEEEQEERGNGRKKLLAAVLAGAVVTGLGLGFLYKSTSRTSGTEPETVTADARPIKETPRTPGGKTFPGGNKLIQDRLGGGSGEGEAPTLASSAEPAGAEPEAAGVVMTTGGGNGTLEERIQNALRDAKKPEGAAAADAAPSSDAPQTVKTVKVNPDGSFADGMAGGGSRARAYQAPKPETQPAAVVEASPEEEAAPQPVTRPAAARPQRVAAVDTSAAPSSPVQVTETTGGTGNYFVQIGARNQQDDAMKAFAVMQQKYASVIGNHQPSVRKVDLAEKGTWYRMRVGPFNTKDDAEQLCNDLKTAGWKQCFSVKD